MGVCWGRVGELARLGDDLARWLGLAWRVLTETVWRT